MGPLTALFPRSKPVPLGDRTYRVWELRIAELAELQECLDDVTGCPFERALEAVDGAESESARRDVLSDAYDRIEAGLPSLWDDEGSAWLSSLAGLASFVLVALKRGQPSITAEDVLALIAPADDTAPRITAAQYARLRRVAFGVRPLRVLERMLGLDDDARPGSPPPLSWAEIVAELCERYGWAPGVVEGLTLTQLALFRSGGKREESGASLDGLSDEEIARRAEEQRRRFYGRETEPDATSPDEGTPA